MTQSQSYAGEFLRNYKPRTNFNSIINSFYGKRVAFLPAQFASLQTEVQFPDCSFYQGEIDFDIMATKTRAIILRAGQGTYKDEQFDRNYAEAKRVGLLMGVYFFFDDRVDPRKQAETLIRILGGKTIEMEVFIDWENSYGGQFKGLANVVAMMQLLENYGYTLGMYTGYFWFRENSNPITNAGQYAYLKNKALWLAWYTTNPANVLIPAPWLRLTHWQWGTPAVAWGQKSREIDMNHPDMTEEEFNKHYGINQGEPMTDYVELKSALNSNHSIRRPTAYPATPHIFGTSFASLLAGTTAQANPEDFYVYASDVAINGVKQAYAGDKWWRIMVGTDVGWIAEIHKGVKYLTTRLVSTIPVPAHTVDVFVDGELVYHKDLD